MSYTYSQWVDASAELLVVEPSFPNYVSIVPSAIDYAEQRIYRDLDLLDTVVRDNSGTLTANSRNFTLPTTLGRFVVTNGINVYTPMGSTQTRNQLVAVSRDYMDAVWSSETAPTVPSIPTCYAMVTDQQIIVGPPPDAGYFVECIGTIRPTPLSASNPTTYLTIYLPDIWMAATMVFFTGFQQNFGAQADNPQMAQSWESQYKTLIGSANVEEQRKRYASGAWGSLSPTPIASPSR